jgi:hypothetical protein
LFEDSTLETARLDVPDARTQVFPEPVTGNGIGGERMDTERSESETRRLLLGTAHGTIEGAIAVGQQVRTLDYLNRGSLKFVPLRAAKATPPFPALQGGAVSVNIATILWVTEVQAMRPGGLSKVKPQLNRCAVRFCFPDCEALGFLHTPPQGDPFARLNQDRGAFLALTSVSLVGAEAEMTVEFLAVNSLHVLTAEIIAQDDTVLEGTSVFEEAGS